MDRDVLELSQTSKMERFAQVINGYKPLTFFKKVPSLMFDWILNVFIAEFKTSPNKFALCSNFCQKDRIPFHLVACNTPYEYSKSH